MARRHRRTPPPAIASYAGPERRRFVNRSWPLPAFAAWGASWCVLAFAAELGAPPAAAFLAAGLFGAALSLLGATPWRRVFIGCGFPLSFLASGSAGSVPAWAWLLPLAALAIVYPWRTWRDAPFFPTRRGTLAGLASALPLPPQARVLDAGCGLGDALAELRREYPQARFAGVEWSGVLARAAAWRCRFADVSRGDMWALPWSGHDLVYVFQRPESMARAWTKARSELAPGAWLASLEFSVEGVEARAVHRCPDGRPVWLYQV